MAPGAIASRLAPTGDLYWSLITCAQHITCGSELARDSGITAKTD